VRDDHCVIRRKLPRRNLAAEPKADPRLDPYRRGVARLWAGDQLVGYLATSVQVWWTISGPFWRRSGGQPTEKVERLISYVRRDPRDHADGWDDGVTDGVDWRVEEWDSGRFTHGRDEVLRIEWLENPDADGLRERHGWS
jgi:hypothetical protein